MTTVNPHHKISFRIKSALLSTLVAFPLFAAGCSSQDNSNLAPIDDTQSQRPRLNNTQKTLITLAGAAALYYLYNQHKHSQEQGPNGQYYLSKNGRVYYRDAQHRAHWVTPPSEGIQVPAEEAHQYREFQGYDNQPTGRDLTSLSEVQTAQ